MASVWVCRPGVTAEALGLLPLFLDEADPRDARAQIAEKYCGGWDSFKANFTLCRETGALSYPGDPDMIPLAFTTLHGTEGVFLYPCDFVMIHDRKTGEFDIARIS